MWSWKSGQEEEKLSPVEFLDNVGQGSLQHNVLKVKASVEVCLHNG